MSWLIGKYFKEAHLRYRQGKRLSTSIYKVTDLVKSSNEADYLIAVDILTQEVKAVTIDTVNSWTICVGIPKDDVDMVSIDRFSMVFVKDHYLHRVGGPALIIGNEKEYYLSGNLIDIDTYMETMSEDIQTEMCFKINELQ